MATLSAEARQWRARIAAHAKLSQQDPRDHCAVMRRALWSKYLVQADPDNELDAEERERRARQAMRADLSRIAFEAAKRRQEEADGQIADALLQAGGVA